MWAVFLLLAVMDDDDVVLLGFPFVKRLPTLRNDFLIRLPYRHQNYCNDGTST